MRTLSFLLFLFLVSNCGYDVGNSRSTQEGAPEWKSDTIRLVFFENMALSLSITDYVRDPNDLPLEFSTVGAPSWFFLGTNGLIQGVTSGVKPGIYRFQVKASNGKTFSMVNVELEIRASP